MHSSMPNGHDGPFLLAAVICEKVLQEVDGVASAIRIIDRHIVTPAPGQPASSKMPLIQLNYTLFVNLKSGSKRGRFTVKLVFRGPSGLKLQEAGLPILLEGEERGANVIVPFYLQLDQEGLYWFDVYFEDTVLTSVPLRVMYQATTLTTPPQL
jgi:hypothetical protein